MKTQESSILGPFWALLADFRTNKNFLLSLCKMYVKIIEQISRKTGPSHTYVRTDKHEFKGTSRARDPKIIVILCQKYRSSSGPALFLNLLSKKKKQEHKKQVLSHLRILWIVKIKKERQIHRVTEQGQGCSRPISPMSFDRIRVYQGIFLPSHLTYLSIDFKQGEIAFSFFVYSHV